MSSQSGKSVYSFGVIKAINFSYQETALILHVCLLSRALPGSNENEHVIQYNHCLEFLIAEEAKGLNGMKLLRLRV